MRSSGSASPQARPADARAVRSGDGGWFADWDGRDAVAIREIYASRS